MSRSPLVATLVALLAATCAVAADAEPAGSPAAPTKLLRFPDIHGDRVVFSYAGDLWTRFHRRRVGVAPDGPPRARALRQVLARRPLDRVHRAVRRRRAGLRRPGRRRRAAAAHLLPGARAAHRRAGATTTRSTAGRRTARSVLFRSLRDADGGRTETALYTVPLAGGLADDAADARRSGAGDLSPDGKQARLLAALPRLPHLEALRGRLGPGPVSSSTSRPHAVEPVAPSLRTERDPMWIGEAIYFVSDRDGDAQPLPLRPRPTTTSSSSPARRTWDVRWASSRQPRARSCTSWTASCARLRHRDAAAHRRLVDHRPRRRRRRRPVAHLGGPADRGLRAVAEGRARAVRRARRRLHRADREGPDAQPDRKLLRRARPPRPLVARRPPVAFVSDRSRRGPDLARRAGRRGRAEQLTNGFAAMLYAPRLVAGRQAPRLLRQGRQGLRVSRRRRQARRRGRRRPRRSGRRLRLVARRVAPRLLAAARPTARARSGSGRSPTAASAATGELFNEYRAGLGSRGPVPVLPVRPGVRAADLGPRVELRRQPAHRHLRPRAARDVPHPFPARERRGQAARRSSPSRARRRRAREKRPAESGPKARASDPQAARHRLRRARPPASSASRSTPTTSTVWPSPPRRCSSLRRGAPFYGRESYDEARLRIFDLKKREATVARRGLRRLRPVARRCQGPGPPGRELHA